MVRPAHRVCRYVERTFLAALLVFGLAPARASQQESVAHIETAAKPYDDPDAYAIYAILLAHNKDSSFVMKAETESYGKVTPEGPGIKGDRRFHKVWGDALNDYAKRYFSPSLLMRSISISTPYELVSTEKVQAIFESGGWEEFYKSYPLSRGMYWFSAVGFGRHKTHAIVQMNYQCGGLCGKGEPHFFEKKDGKWREVRVTATVTVWVS
jgi:hypothetical protein